MPTPSPIAHLPAGPLEQSFGLTVETLVAQAMELDHISDGTGMSAEYGIAADTPHVQPRPRRGHGPSHAVPTC